jgi:uncharacterized membrane protein YczE
MKYSPKNFIRLIIGLFIFTVGIVLTINANLGLAPWDIFHQGLSKTVGITMGQANIIVAFFIVILDVALGSNVGWGTLFNMIFFGVFIDFIMLNNLLPMANTFVSGVAFILVGLLIQGYGCYIYVSAGMGAGPRDGLMFVLTEKTGKSIRLIKILIEVVAVVAGVILGGTFGVGTVILAVTGGPIFQFAFRTVKFDSSKVDHRYISEDWKLLKNKM